MSQHAIEDLVEDTIHLVDRSTLDAARRTTLMHALLRLQERYDTSLTWFRLPDILLRHGVLQRLPVATLEDAGLRARALAADAPGWIEHGDAAWYLQIEDGASLLYRQAPLEQPLPLAELFLAVLELAEAEGDAALGNDWYGLLVNGWLDGSLDAADGLPGILDGLLASPTLSAIRALAARNAFKRRRDAREDLALPRLADELEPGEVEREFALRFFLELKRSTSALLKARDKARERHARISQLIPSLVEQRIGSLLQSAGWRPVVHDKPGEWRWMRDVAGGRQCIWFTQEAALGVLMVQLGLQHPRLLGWERRAPSEDLHALHFQHIAAGFMPDGVRDGKDVGAFGGWTLDPSKSEAQLTAAIDRLVEVLPGLDERYFGFIDRSVPALFGHDVDTLLHLLEEGDENGIVPEHVLFDSPDSLLLAFVFHHLEQGEEDAASALVDRLRSRQQQRRRATPWARDFLVPFLQRWDDGQRDMPMPPVLHALLAGHLRSLEPA